MNIGDLVIITHSDYSPFYARPDVGIIGIIVEIQRSSFMGTIYYVHTTDGIWRFSDYELELINGSGWFS